MPLLAGRYFFVGNMANNTFSGTTQGNAFTSTQDIEAASSYDVYSGADIKAVIHIPPNFVTEQVEESGTGQAATPDLNYSKPIVLGDIQTLTYSIYREKYPVRTIGMAYPKGFTRGPRTISGTLIFTVFNKQVLYDLMTRVSSDTSHDVSTPLIDQLPRFDITITFSNEHGAVSTMVIYGVEIISEGTTMSIEDFFTENVVQYIAQDMRPMLPDTGSMSRLATEMAPKTATDLVREKLQTDRTLDLTIKSFENI